MGQGSGGPAGALNQSLNHQKKLGRILYSLEIPKVVLLHSSSQRRLFPSVNLPVKPEFSDI